VKIDNGKTGYI